MRQRVLRGPALARHKPKHSEGALMQKAITLHRVSRNFHRVLQFAFDELPAQLPLIAKQSQPCGFSRLAFGGHHDPRA